MTKKDYIKLAQALKDSKPTLNMEIDNRYSMKEQSLIKASAIASWQMTVNHLAATLQLDNPQFSRKRFLHACGYTQEG